MHSKGYSSCHVCVLSVSPFYSPTEQYVVSKKDTSDLRTILTLYLKRCYFNYASFASYA